MASPDEKPVEPAGLEAGPARVALEKVERALSTARQRRVALMGDRARAEFLEVSAPMRSHILGSLKARMKASILADPDMWQCVRSAGSVVVDEVLEDVEKEVERNLQAALLQQRRCAAEPGPTGGFLLPWYRFRALMLHHYFPPDKMFFGKIQDPIYLIIYLATLVPVHGVRVCVFALLLLGLAFPGSPDEFQLINFILLSKGFQFLTSGLIQMAVGASKYFVCYSVAKDSLLHCLDTGGPGAGDGYGLAIDYLGSIALVWAAFGLLERSEKHGTDRHTTQTIEEAERARQAGGRLRSLLRYDRRCFIASVLVLVALTVWNCPRHFARGLRGLGGLYGDPQFSANIFWCCVGYSILSLPFAAFMIPLFRDVMTHSFPTGYNREGACVPFGLPVAEEEAGPIERTDSQVDSTSYYAQQATRILTTINRGRAMRGAGPSADDYKLEDILWDFGNGAWSMLTGHQSPESRTSGSLP